MAPVGGGRMATGHTHSPTSGTKLTQQTSSHRTRGIKFALLAQNGPFWHVFRMQGELCTVFVSKQPCRANFVPLSPGRSHAWRTLYRMRGRDGASHHSTPGTAGVEGAGGTGGHKRVRLRCPWAVAGPGRAAHRHPDRLEAAAWPAGLGRASRRRAERSSQRGRRAGGQAARRPEICRGNKQQSAAGVEGAGGRALRRPEHPWGHEQPCQTGHTNHNLRNWAASRPTARSTRNAILKSPGHLQCRRRNAPQVRR